MSMKMEESTVHNQQQQHQQKQPNTPPSDVMASLFTENWGHSVINHEKSWDLPPSPPGSSSSKFDNDDTYWPATINSNNTGTEIWETTVRQKNKSSGLVSHPPIAPSAVAAHHHPSHNQTHWNPTPASHIGGTWGEEEDNSSVWTGVPQTNGSSSQSVSSTSNASNGSWGVPKTDEPTIGWKEPSSSDSLGNRSWGASSSWVDNNKSGFRTEPPPEKLGTAVWGAETTSSKPPVLSSKPSVDSQYWKKDSTSSPSSGWDDDSSGSGDRRDSRDDGTAVWGNPDRQKQSRVSHWREEQELSQQLNAKLNFNSANGNNAPSLSPTGSISGTNGSNALLPSSPGMIRLPPTSNNMNKPTDWMKPSQTLQQPRHWSDVVATPGWGQPDVDKGRSWGDARDGPSSPLSSWGRSKSSPSWSEGQVDTSSWSSPKQKPLTKEMILASKQFRILTEMGFKKEDAEAVLRAYNMDLDEALNELRSKPLASGSNTPSSSLLSSRPQQSQNFSSSFGGGKQFNDVSSALRASSARPTGQADPNEKQLMLLVEQIKLAVQTGHLNAQILNQPLAPQTIQLIYQLLQQIKLLQQLQTQVAGSMGKNALNPTNTIQSTLHVHITQTKQRISNLQNQIAIQQALYMKHHQMGGSGGGSGSSQPNQTPNDATAAINKQASRLETTWKLPSFDKDNDIDMFGRASGLNANKNRDSAWSSLDDTNNTTGLGGSGAGGSATTAWSDGSDMFKDTPTSVPSTSFIADLVPEFEPGKPWKGSTQMKSIEDDPHLTPGSVNRSPLSVSFNNWSSKVSPTESTAAEAMASLSLSSGTWAFSTASSFNADSSKPKPSITSWSSGADTNTTDSSSIWAGTSSTKTRPGPPPGLSQLGLPPIKTSTGTGSPPVQSGLPTFWSKGSQSLFETDNTTGFLLLFNLNPHTDLTTLKTICHQHGNLHVFHRLPNHGACLVGYSSQDIANKANASLNNCRLGSTTIMSKIPSNSEVQQLLSINNSSTVSQNWNSITFENNVRSTAGQSASHDNDRKLSNGSWEGLWNYSSSTTNNTSNSMWSSSDDPLERTGCDSDR